MAKIWIDAVRFDEKGDWRVETQFVRETGGAYLLAVNTPGYPAQDAKTALVVGEPGMYRVWVRTRNWLRPDAPGRFRALIDGERIGIEMGSLPTDRWTWQAAGDVFLESGEHTLVMRDTTGYFPRFSAVLITDDMDYTPSPEWERIRAERAALLGESDEIRRSAPYDLVVAGAGPGGIPAAIAAARLGYSVALLHSRPAVGGNAAREANVGFDGAYIRHPGMREGGIAEEIRRLRDSQDKQFCDALEQLCAETENLSVILNACVIGAEMDSSKGEASINAAIAVDTITGVRTAYPAKMFIDATGDGWLGYYAGAAHRVGREAFWQHKEAHAPLYPDTRTMSGCLMGAKDLIKLPIERQRDCGDMLSYYAVDSGEPSPFHAPKWAQILPEKLHRWPNRLHTGEWWIENPTDFDDLFDAELTRDHLMLISLAYFDWLKNSYERRDLAANLKIVGFPTFNAKRESRRLIGDYILTEDDVVNAKPFHDAVAYAGWSVDVHNQDGIFSGAKGPYDFDLQVGVNQVPYRCLYSKNVSNLLMAGRCISVSHVALGTVRVENTLATIGQAAGSAAALCLSLGVTPRELGQTHLKALQQRLLRDDQYIPGLVNEDPADLAREATITATSVSATERFTRKRGIARDWIALDDTLAILFRRPGESVKATAIEVLARNLGDETAFEYEWSSFTDGLEGRRRVIAGSGSIPGGFEGYVTIPAQGLTADSLRGMLCLTLRASGAEARRVEFANHSMQLARYESPYWRVQRNSTIVHSFAGETEEPLADCSPESVINGVARPLSADCYGWASDPAQSLPQELTLTFDKPTDLTKLQFVFDTDLVNPLFSFQWNSVVPKLVKEYDLLIDGVVVDSVRDNQLRVRRHQLNVKGAASVTLRVLATWGDPSARVFEVRAYAD